MEDAENESAEEAEQDGLRRLCTRVAFVAFVQNSAPCTIQGALSTLAFSHNEGNDSYTCKVKAIQREASGISEISNSRSV